MRENYKRAQEKRQKVLAAAKEEAVREWQYTKNQFDVEKLAFDKLDLVYQVAKEQVSQTTRSLEEARSENEKLKRYYGIVERPATPTSSSVNLSTTSVTSSPSFPPALNLQVQTNSASPSPSPSPRPRQSGSTPPSPRRVERERGGTDPIRPALTTFNSPPQRPLSTSFANGSPIRPKMVRRSSDPPPKHAYFASPQQQQEQLQQQYQQNQQQQQQQLPSVPENIDSQAQQKLQVHQQLLQQIQNQLQNKFPSPSSSPTPSSSIPPLSLPTSPLLASPPVSKSPQIPIRLNPSPQPQIKLKSLPPLPLHVLSQQNQYDNEEQNESKPTSEITEKQRVIHNLQEQERKQMLPRSHSDDQTKSKSKNFKHTDLSSSLPNLPDFIEPTSSSNSSSQYLQRSSSQNEPPVNYLYSSLKPDEIAHLDETQALVDYLEAELELNVSLIINNK